MNTQDRSAVNGGKLTRRDLLSRTGFGTAAGALAAAGCTAERTTQAGPEPKQIARAPSKPSEKQRAIKPRRPLGANDRINVAVIGLGSRGNHLLRDVIKKAQGNPKLAATAVCEIYKRRADNALKRVSRQQTGKDTDGTLYHEYEKLLDEADCDAVVIATPDHWHGQIACDAIAAGKDVYVEKPMCHTIEQAHTLYRLTKRTGAVVQVGAQSTSDAQYYKAREMICNGAIGKVVWVRSGYNRNRPGGDWNYKIWPDCTPKTLDWDRFLGLKYGLAAKRPFSPERFFRFRKYWDYSGGIATDLLYHQLAHLMVALNGGTFPRRVTASGGNWVAKEREVPDTFLMNIDYTDGANGVPGGYSVFLIGTSNNDKQLQEVFHGQHGSMIFGGPRLEPQGPFKAQFEAAKKAGAHDVPMPKTMDHMANFLDCMRTRAKPNGHVELGYKVQVAITMAVTAYRQGKAMFFDSKTHKATPA
jgi:predicted dehydrogenase